jgi:hypothetical protein
VPAKVKARPCPNCDGKVTRDRRLAKAEKELDKLRDHSGFYHEPREQFDLEDEIAARNAPVTRLPNPYYMPIATGGVQIFRVPAHCRRRAPVRRRR